VIEGVENDAVVVVARMHHATIGRVSGSSLLTSILDLEALPVDESPSSRTGRPKHKPSDLELLQHAIVSRLRPAARARPRVGDANLLRGAIGITPRPNLEPAVGGRPSTPRRTPWNAPLHAARRVAFRVPAARRVKAMRNAFGCT